MSMVLAEGSTMNMPFLDSYAAFRLRIVPARPVEPVYRLEARPSC